MSVHAHVGLQGEKRRKKPEEKRRETRVRIQSGTLSFDKTGIGCLIIRDIIYRLEVTNYSIKNKKRKILSRHSECRT